MAGRHSHRQEQVEKHCRGVDQGVQQPRSLALVVAPEGTRNRVNYWKTGFYYIAHGAGVPIALGFLDYRRKVGGLGPTVYPTGDIKRDLDHIQEFYRTVTARRPEKTESGHIDYNNFAKN